MNPFYGQSPNSLSWIDRVFPPSPGNEPLRQIFYELNAPSAQSMPYDSFTRGLLPIQQLPQKKEPFSWKRAITSFAKGATVDMIKGMLTPQGLAMLGGTFLITMATGGLAIPFLLTLGLGMGGYQLAKGINTAATAFKKGDNEAGYEGLEQAGMGTGIIGLSFWGAKTTYAKGAIHGKAPTPDITVKQSLAEVAKDVTGINRASNGQYMGRAALESLWNSARNLGRSVSGQGSKGSNGMATMQTAMAGHAHTEHGLVMPPGGNDKRDDRNGGHAHA